MGNKILIVEDDPLIRESLSELLESEGFVVHSAENGKIALDYLCDTDTLPNLILLDLRMPIKDGIQFCIEQKLNKEIAQIPVVIMSADGDIEKKQVITQAQGYIKKPLNIDEMLKTIKRYCF
jgi:DNA-binding response OmpR family regulator